MKEEYLHYIWKLKRLPFHQMRLSDGKEFQLLNQGVYNRFESGPDFSDGRILVDGLIWVGPIEIHIRSSDWKAHGHLNDSAYDNVILHVVYHNDMDIVQNGRLLPVLELRSFIDKDHLNDYQSLVKNVYEIPCNILLPKIDPYFLFEMIDRSALERIERKSQELNGINGNSPQDVLYILLARSFGNKMNSRPFEELGVRLPLAHIKKMNSTNRISAVKQVSGLFDPISIQDCLLKREFSTIIKSLNSGTVKSYSWKFKGGRPSGFPTKRVEQFAYFVDEFNFDYLFVYMSPNELHYYLMEIIANINRKIPSAHLKISKLMSEMLIINCFVVFVYWFGKLMDRFDLCQNALELLKLIPSEKNHIIENWKKVGFKAINALDSQGLLELFNNRCLKKKCLSCSVGNKVLKG